MWWARLPAGARAPQDTVAEDMALFGAKNFKLPDWMTEQDVEEPEECGVLIENWEAVQVFLACGTQWRQDRNGILTGLRYDALDILLKRFRIEDPDDAFWRVQVMENAAVKEFLKLAKPKT